MRTRQILEGSSIVLGVFFVFLVQNSALSTYSTYLLAILIIFSSIYIAIKRRSSSASQLFSGEPFELFAITAIILFIIALSGSLNSTLFFFLYFLLFLYAFMCSSITIVILLLSLILYFIPEASANLSTDTFIKLGSLLLIAPIAYFISTEFERRQLLSKKIEAKTDDIIQEAQLLKDSDSNKGSDESEAIDEIIEEAQSLKEDSKD